MAKRTINVDLKQLSKLAEEPVTLVRENPWLIPAALGVEIIPLSLMILGRTRNQIYRKKLQIEREKTKQLAMKLEHGHCRHGHGHHGHPKHKDGQQRFEPSVPKRLAHKAK